MYSYIGVYHTLRITKNFILLLISGSKGMCCNCTAWHPCLASQPRPTRPAVVAAQPPLRPCTVAAVAPLRLAAAVAAPARVTAFAPSQHPIPRFSPTHCCRCRLGSPWPPLCCHRPLPVLLDLQRDINRREHCQGVVLLICAQATHA